MYKKKRKCHENIHDLPDDSAGGRAIKLFLAANYKVVII